MAERITRNIIDLHCDTLFECDKRGISLEDGALCVSLGRLPAGQRHCQVMAAFIPDSLRGEAAESHFLRLSALFDSQTARFSDRISRIETTSEIVENLERKPFAAVLAIEGGAALAGKLENVERFYNLGVRMMTLTWNAENEIAGGAETDIGLTGFGRAVIPEMERTGMAVDVSHLSDKAFWELCGVAEKPFLASHSNSRAVCGHPRNLTDDMFMEIVRRGGVVGLNFCRKFIRRDGESGTVGDWLRHAHHFLELGGETTLAIGSDFDGTDVPDYLDCGIGSLDYLAGQMEGSGIPTVTVNRILFENANRFFKNLSGEV